APRHLHVADTAGVAAVDVLAALQADLGAGLDQRLAQHRRLDLARHAERPAAAAHRVLAADPRLRALEERQYVVVGPRAVAELRPVVEVLGLAAHVGEAVDLAGAAEAAAARVDHRAAGGVGIGLGAVAPRDGRVVEQLHEAGRDMDVGVA